MKSLFNEPKPTPALPILTPPANAPVILPGELFAVPRETQEALTKAIAVAVTDKINPEYESIKVELAMSLECENDIQASSLKAAQNKLYAAGKNIDRIVAPAQDFLKSLYKAASVSNKSKIIDEKIEKIKAARSDYDTREYRKKQEAARIEEARLKAIKDKELLELEEKRKTALGDGKDTKAAVIEEKIYIAREAPTCVPVIDPPKTERIVQGLNTHRFLVDFLFFQFILSLTTNEWVIILNAFAGGTPEEKKASLIFAFETIAMRRQQVQTDTGPVSLIPAARIEVKFTQDSLNQVQVGDRPWGRIEEVAAKPRSSGR